MMKILLKQKGLASVEFAIGMAVLLLLMLATVELGRAYYTYNTLTKSVRAGARYLSGNAYHGAAIDLTAKQAIAENIILTGHVNGGSPVLYSFDSADLSISQVQTGNEPHVNITANYAYTPLLSTLPTFGMGDGPIDLSFNMQAISVMRIIR